MKPTVLRLTTWREDDPTLGPDCANCRQTIHVGGRYAVGLDRRRDVLTMVCGACLDLPVETQKAVRPAAPKTKAAPKPKPAPKHKRARQQACPTVACEICGTSFRAHRYCGGRLQKYCSVACYRQTPPRRPSGDACERCGESFPRRWAHGRLQRYCSRACSDDRRHPRRDVVCSNCQQTFTSHWQGPQRGYTRYCCIACRNRGVARQKRREGVAA